VCGVGQDYHAGTALIAHACICAYIYYSDISSVLEKITIEIEYTYDKSDCTP